MNGHRRLARADGHHGLQQRCAALPVQLRNHRVRRALALPFLWLIFVGSIVVMAASAAIWGSTSLIVRLPRSGKIAFVLISNVLMLWVCYLFFVGSWRQTVLGWGTLKPATGIPMAFHYATGLVMSVGIVLHNTWRVLSGQANGC